MYHISGSSRTAGIAGLMASFWIFEVVPLPVTSLLPMVLFPLFDVASGATIAAEYFNHVVRACSRRQARPAPCW